jgi:hypothetical protein
MRKITVVLTLALLAFACGASAQLRVQLDCGRDTFLLYEAIPLVLEIHNYTARTVELAGEEGKPWLSFVVTDENGDLIEPTSDAIPSESILIAAGETVARTVDLLPYYQLRHRGNFKAQAYISAKGVKAVSKPFRFSVMHGRVLTSVTKGLPIRDGEPEQYRTYSLLVRALQEGELLYALVRDDANQRAFELVALGKFLSTMKPEMEVDRDGDFHVLFQSAPRLYGYAHISTEGRLVERKVFSDYMSAPDLSVRDGEVSVAGGEQIYPKVEHIMTEEELNPPPLPPPPKKKPWWKFWGSSSTSTNSTPTAIKQ